MVRPVGWPAGTVVEKSEGERETAGQEILLNVFTVREVRLRGLVATGRSGQAVDLARGITAEDDAEVRPVGVLVALPNELGCYPV